jgi:hypothetical protein
MLSFVKDVITEFLAIRAERARASNAGEPIAAQPAQPAAVERPRLSVPAALGRAVGATAGVVRVSAWGWSRTLAG